MNRAFSRVFPERQCFLSGFDMNALYQGTTLAGPQIIENMSGFSPHT